LKDGEAVVALPEEMLKRLDSNKGYLVYVSAIGETHGVYVSRQTQTEFVLSECNQGKSNATVNWMVVGTQK
jgi:hypothetical protein